MHDSAKYLIHADIEARGVVERSDVVGAIFGQTEGLLGDELDIRDLQESGQLGRIEVEVDSEGGQSFGTVTIASGLDRVETAILAAALETIERVGPCRADVEVTELEDTRTAKRREVVDRATALLAEFDETALTGPDIVAEVRKAVRVEDITEFGGLPAGPRVEDSDAVVVVEGRSDVLALLEYGVKNAIAVEGTNVPDAVAELTRDRTVTAFLDGDRGGDLILKELAQVGEIDHVALAPPGRSVEDLTRTEALSALRDKVPFEAVDETPGQETGDGTAGPVASDGDPSPTTESEGSPGSAGGGTSAGDRADDPQVVTDGAAGETGHAVTEDSVGDGSSAPTAGAGTELVEPTDRDRDESGSTDGETDRETDGKAAADADSDGHGSTVDTPDGSTADDTAPEPGRADEPSPAEREPMTLAGHVDAVVGGETGLARALDEEWDPVDERPAGEAFDLVESVTDPPTALVVDGELPQRVLDVAAQRGVEQVVCASEGEYVKQPTDVRIRTAADL